MFIFAEDGFEEIDRGMAFDADPVSQKQTPDLYLANRETFVCLPGVHRLYG